MELKSDRGSATRRWHSAPVLFINKITVLTTEGKTYDSESLPIHGALKVKWTAFIKNISYVQNEECSYCLRRKINLIFLYTVLGMMIKAKL